MSATDPTSAIMGNLIGVGADGTTAIGNQGNGILVVDSLAVLIGAVGGPPPLAPNVIANNGGNGVAISGPNAFAVSVQGNSISNNSRLESTSTTTA